MNALYAQSIESQDTVTVKRGTLKLVVNANLANTPVKRVRKSQRLAKNVLESELIFHIVNALKDIMMMEALSAKNAQLNVKHVPKMQIIVIYVQKIDIKYQNVHVNLEWSIWMEYV